MAMPRTDAALTLPDLWLTIKPVPSAGFGVFVRDGPAAIALPANTVIGQYTGRAMRVADAESASEYQLAVSPPYSYIIDAASANRVDDLPPFVIDSAAAAAAATGTLTPDEQQTTWTRYINSIGGALGGHGSQNVEYVQGEDLLRLGGTATTYSVLPQAGMPSGDAKLLPGRVYVVTTRDIAPGEQLLVNYGDSYFAVSTAACVVQDVVDTQVRLKLLNKLAGVTGSHGRRATAARAILEQAANPASVLVETATGAAPDVVGMILRLMGGRVITHMYVQRNLTNDDDVREVLLRDATYALRGPANVGQTLGPQLQVYASHAAMVFGSDERKARSLIHRLGFTLHRNMYVRPVRPFAFATMPERFSSIQHVRDWGAIFDAVASVRPDYASRIDLAAPGIAFARFFDSLDKTASVAGLLVEQLEPGRYVAHAVALTDNVRNQHPLRAAAVLWDVIDALEAGNFAIVYADRGSMLAAGLKRASWQSNRLRNFFEFCGFVPPQQQQTRAVASLTRAMAGCSFTAAALAAAGPGPRQCTGPAPSARQS